MIIALVAINSFLCLGIVVAVLYVNLRQSAYLNPGAYRKVSNTDKIPLFKNEAAVNKVVEETLGGGGEKPPFKSALNDFIKS